MDKTIRQVNLSIFILLKKIIEIIRLLFWLILGKIAKLYY